MDVRYYPPLSSEGSSERSKLKTRTNPATKRFNGRKRWAAGVAKGCLSGADKGEGRKERGDCDGSWTRGEVEKGEGTDRRSISCPVHGVCSLVKHCVAFGIYRASSHLKLICLFAAGSCPGGVKPRGEFAGGTSLRGKRARSPWRATKSFSNSHLWLSLWPLAPVTARRYSLCASPGEGISTGISEPKAAESSRRAWSRKRCRDAIAAGRCTVRQYCGNVNRGDWLSFDFTLRVNETRRTAVRMQTTVLCAVPIIDDTRVHNVRSDRRKKKTDYAVRLDVINDTRSGRIIFITTNS